MFDYKMKLTDEQLEILNGAQGATMAKVMQTMVMFGEFLGASELVPITHQNGHLSTSFGIGTLKPLFEVMDKLINDEIKTVAMIKPMRLVFIFYLSWINFGALPDSFNIASRNLLKARSSICLMRSREILYFLDNVSNVAAGSDNLRAFNISRSRSGKSSRCLRNNS